MSLKRWVLTEEERASYIEALTSDIAVLRAKAGISQGELCNLIGISRQTLSAIEGKRKSMSWNTYIALVWFFDYNKDTRDLFRSMPSYPAQIITRMNEGNNPEQNFLGQTAAELDDLLRELDDQAKHALKTMLLVEYARCKNISGETVVKAFDGTDLFGSTSDAAAEIALRNIRKKK